MKLYIIIYCKIFLYFRWEKPGHSPLFRYDYWYQPRHKTMISTSWGAPAAFTQGFNLQHVSDGLYGRHLHVYSWPEGEHVSDGLYGRPLHVYSWPEGEHVSDGLYYRHLCTFMCIYVLVWYLFGKIGYSSKIDIFYFFSDF
ncbi:putative selenium-binding protein [Helianthus anomalus]